MTTLSRRGALRVALAAGTLPLAGCERVWSGLASELGERVPERVEVAASTDVDPTFHLLSRAAHGPWPGELERARAMGADAWIEEQLAPDGIDDRACELRARRWESADLDPGDAWEMKRPVLRGDLTRATLLRAVYSRRQLRERMVGFWTDQFNVDASKGDVLYFVPELQRALRAHALGKLRDLVRAALSSGAMLLYLDGASSGTAAPNENHARELLELHTLGVHGGYAQGDVREVARALTGWRVKTDGFGRGRVRFDAGEHDDGPKRVLGVALPAGLGAGDVERVLDVVCDHPSTAAHVAEKLTRAFVSDEPPAGLASRAARVLVDTGGDIAAAVRVILRSDELRASAGQKLKRPLDYVASALRGLGADTHAPDALLETLGRMGQSPFAWPTPDGYPDRADAWTGTLLWRWNFAFALTAGELGARVPIAELARAIGSHAPSRWFAHLVGRLPSETERRALDAHVAARGIGDGAELVALVLASPAFQRC